MFIIFPTGHEQTTARRWPLVTIFLVAANVLVFMLLRPVEANAIARAEEPFAQAIEQLQAHPYLEPPPFLSAQLSPHEHALLAEARAKVRSIPEGEQATLDELVEQAQAALAKVPSFRFGYRPADKNWLGLFTHQFLHGGWLHLFGNMWFLWLAGYVIEDGWGRLAFPAFYLCAGVVAAFGHHLAEPHSALPLIGASGAIAGVMGAFLVRNAKTKIKFFAWLIVRPFRFAAPAFVMLPLWFAEQVVWGVLQPGGVAYFAHVGGFVFGTGVALVLRHTGAQQRLDQAIEDRGALLEDPFIAEMASLIDAGKADIAVARLGVLVASEPRRIDAWLELLRATSAMGDAAAEKRVRLKLIELYLQQGLGDGALSLYEEWSAAERLSSVPPPLRLRIGRQYERAGRADRARSTFLDLHAPVDAPAAAATYDRGVVSAALIAHAELAIKLGLRDEALELWTRAQSDGDPQFAQIVKQGLARAAGLPRSLARSRR